MEGGGVTALERLNDPKRRRRPAKSALCRRSPKAVPRSAGSFCSYDRDPGAHAPGRIPRRAAGVEVFMPSCVTRTGPFKNRKMASLTPVLIPLFPVCRKRDPTANSSGNHFESRNSRLQGLTSMPPCVMWNIPLTAKTSSFLIPANLSLLAASTLQSTPTQVS